GSPRAAGPSRHRVFPLVAKVRRFEVGDGYAHAGILGRVPSSPTIVTDAQIPGQIADLPVSGGRQFTGDSPQKWWFTKGSSGSPVFLKSGQQLAGLVSLSELGANEGESHLHEALVVPATTIRRHLVKLLAKPVANREGIEPADLQQILDRIGAQDVPVS